MQHPRFDAGRSADPKNTKWITIAGTFAMGVAISATILFVAHLAFGLVTAAITATFATVLTLWAWAYLPVINCHASRSTS